MKCPYCDKEMQSGYIQCRDGLHWTPKKQKVAALSGMGKGAIVVLCQDLVQVKMRNFSPF